VGLRERHTEVDLDARRAAQAGRRHAAVGARTFVEQLEPVVREVDRTYRTFVFGHLAEGNLHVNIVGPAADDDAVDGAVFRLVASLGGTISAEHGVGVREDRWLPSSGPTPRSRRCDGSRRARSGRHPSTPASRAHGARPEASACHDRRQPDRRDPATIQVIAHRGSSEEVAEHTLAAYQKAVDDGADALECDVRLTRDGHLVCVHDRRVDRTSNGAGVVSTLELAELAELDWASWKKADVWSDFEDPEVPDRDRSAILTLERLLEVVADADRRVEMAIETKHPTRYAGLVERRVVELLDRFGWAHPRLGRSRPRGS
jgi:hypothetical protein